MDTEQPVAYSDETRPSTDDVIAVFQRSGLPNALADPEKMAKLITTSDLIVCARVNGRLVGFARCLTDFLYSCYLSDLVVDAAYQGCGIGRELVRRIQERVGEGVRLYLFAAPGAEAFYERLGFVPATDARELRRKL